MPHNMLQCVVYFFRKTSMSKTSSQRRRKQQKKMLFLQVTMTSTSQQQWLLFAVRQHVAITTHRFPKIDMKINLFKLSFSVIPSYTYDYIHRNVDTIAAASVAHLFIYLCLRNLQMYGTFCMSYHFQIIMMSKRK